MISCFQTLRFQLQPAPLPVGFLTTPRDDEGAMTPSLFTTKKIGVGGGGGGGGGGGLTPGAGVSPGERTPGGSRKKK